MSEHNYWFKEYCEKTTSHCMEYFVMRQRSLVEKIFWILTFLFVLFLSCTTISSIINVWINSPTITVIENIESSIYDIPFPSITICPSNQLRKSVWERYMNSNSSYWEYLQVYQSKICTGSGYASEIKYQTSDYVDYEMIKNLVTDCPISCPELFQSTEVKWQNISTTNICNLVQPIFSTLGLCFIFNMVPANQMFNNKYYKRYSNFFSQRVKTNLNKTSIWNLDDGYTTQHNNDYLIFDGFPSRTSGVSYYHRLTFRLHTLNNDFRSCPNRNFIEGHFIVVYDNPAGIYSKNARTFIKPDTYTKIQITPYVKKISPDLKRRSPRVRQCYFKNERKLLFFKYYSETNCNKECVLNETKSLCECIRFDWAFLAAKGENICGSAKNACTRRALDNVERSNSQKKCDCLPTCTVINYEVKDTTRYDDWAYLKTTKLAKNDSRGATVEFILKNPYFTAYKAEATLSIYSLISVIGGMLGLFLGLNIVNVFEILYVITKSIIYYIKYIINSL